MATNSFKSINHPLLKRRSIDYLPPSPTTVAATSAAAGGGGKKNPFFLKPISTTTSTTHSATFALSSASQTTVAATSATASGGSKKNSFFTTCTTPSSTGGHKNSFFLKPITTTTSTTPSAVSSASQTTTTTSFDLLRQHLSSKEFRQADEETRRLLIALAGESAQKRGYVFFSEVQFISSEDLKTIDNLWKDHSENKFGYSVQKKIWKKMNKDFTRFFIKVGWMKKLENSEVEQYNYRSFPAEFLWEMEEGTPEGHLPLTNALRGTQLLNSILKHPAFDGDDEEEGEEISEQSEQRNGKPSLSKMFKTNYTF